MRATTTFTTENVGGHVAEQTCDLHRFLANVFINPLMIFPNHIKFMIASAAGTRKTNRYPNMCISMTWQRRQKLVAWYHRWNLHRNTEVTDGQIERQQTKLLDDNTIELVGIGLLKKYISCTFSMIKNDEIWHHRPGKPKNNVTEAKFIKSSFFPEGRLTQILLESTYFQF